MAQYHSQLKAITEKARPKAFLFPKLNFDFVGLAERSVWRLSSSIPGTSSVVNAHSLFTPPQPAVIRVGEN